MLIPDFYTIQKLETTESSITAYILLNPKHDVYKGHFPGQPVVPGIIQLQMVKEVLEKFLDKKLFLRKVSTAKYLRMISPKTTKDLQISIQFNKTDTGGYKANARIASGETVFTKLKAGFDRIGLA